MVMVTEFTPIASLVGGLLIGLSAVLLMLVDGRIAGVAGIASRLLNRDGRMPVRVAFLAGIVVAPLALAGFGLVRPFHLEAGLPTILVGGLLVGFGTVVGSGCTSGHGVCGLSLLSRRSLAAVLVFMATAAATVFIVRHLA
jgi:uncharacterized membrane protein YedE/YeeE